MLHTLLALLLLIVPAVARAQSPGPALASLAEGADEDDDCTNWSAGEACLRIGLTTIGIAALIYLIEVGVPIGQCADAEVARLGSEADPLAPEARSGIREVTPGIAAPQPQDVRRRRGVGIDTGRRSERPPPAVPMETPDDALVSPPASD